MTNNTTRQCVLFKGLSKKIITPRFEYGEQSVLRGLAESSMALVRKAYEKDPDSTPRNRYKKCQYAAGSWNRKRRLVIKQPSP